jgi:hypothetical protein
MLATKKMKIANGETVSGKQYLDGAIQAFDLKPGDYYTALKLLTWIAKGESASDIIEEIKSFWQELERKYQ